MAPKGTEVKQTDKILDSNSQTPKDEAWIMHKVISLISGYDARPLFVPTTSIKSSFVGVFPDIITVCSSIAVSRISPSAIRSLLLHISHLGSAIHLLFKLECALNNIDNICHTSINKRPFPPSLAVLVTNDGYILEDELIGSYNITYDWDWNEDFGGFCNALKMLLDDWRYIMFDIQNNYFKWLNKELGKYRGDYDKFGTTNFKIDRESYTDSLKTPLLELYNFDWFPSADGSSCVGFEKKNAGIYYLYIKMLSYMSIFESLTDIIELFLNAMSSKGYDKVDMCNVMINLLLLFLRGSEVSQNRTCTKLYKFLLFNTMKNSKGSTLNPTGCAIFKSFGSSIEKMTQITNTISIINPTKSQNEAHWPQHLYLPENLLSICDYNIDHTEIRLLERLDFQFQRNIKVGSNFIKSVLDEKFYFNHYLYILNGIVSLQFCGFADYLIKCLPNRPCSVQEHEQLIDILHSAISDWIRHNNQCMLSSISIPALSEIIYSLHFEREEYPTCSIDQSQRITIKVVKDGPITMFLTTESMKMYSDIFTHFIEYAKFKGDVHHIVLKSRALSDGPFRKSLCKILLLLVHLIHCFSTYFSWVINKSWNMIHEIEYGISIEGMRGKHRSYLLFLTQALFVPVDCNDPIYTVCRLNELVTRPITEIFKAPQRVISALEDGCDIDDTCVIYESMTNSVNTLKGVFGSRITSMILDLGDSHPSNCNSGNEMDAKPPICDVVAMFHNLLCFNDRGNTEVLSF